MSEEKEIECSKDRKVEGATDRCSKQDSSEAWLKEQGCHVLASVMGDQESSRVFGE